MVDEAIISTPPQRQSLPHTVVTVARKVSATLNVANSKRQLKQRPNAFSGSSGGGQPAHQLRVTVSRQGRRRSKSSASSKITNPDMLTCVARVISMIPALANVATDATITTSPSKACTSPNGHLTATSMLTEALQFGS